MAFIAAADGDKTLPDTDRAANSAVHFQICLLCLPHHLTPCSALASVDPYPQKDALQHWEPGVNDGARVAPSS